MLSLDKMKEEWLKCYIDKSRKYMIENYLTTYDNTRKSNVAFKLFPKQAEFVDNLTEYDENIVTKNRQSGCTTTFAAKVACEIIMALPESPEKCLIVANSRSLSEQMLAKIKDFLAQFPRWFWDFNMNTLKDGHFKYYFEEDAPHDAPQRKCDPFLISNSGRIIMCNKCEVVAVSSGPNASRGISAPTILVFDEAAFIADALTVYTSAVASVSTGGKICLISTPCGKDPLYYQTVVGAKNKTNSFRVTEFKWYNDPRYNRYLKWYIDITKEDEYGKKTTIREFDQDPHDDNGTIPYNLERWEKLEREGWKPTNPWFELQKKRYNNNTKKIAQELEVSFLGSDNTVIPIETISMQERMNIIDKEGEYLIDSQQPETWIWEQPIANADYIMGVDVSRGDGDDSSVIEIFRIGEEEIVSEDTEEIIGKITVLYQVLQFYGKMPSNQLGVLVNRYGLMYNEAFCVVDCIGSSGDSTILKLQELGYNNLYYDDEALKKYTADQNILSSLTDKNGKKLPGFHYSSIREKMIDNFVVGLSTNTIKIRSRRTITEADTWVFRNGRADHKEGCHDDSLMAIAMMYVVYEFSYKRTAKAKIVRKEILKSFMTTTSTSVNTQKEVDINRIEEVRKKYNIYTPIITSNNTHTAHNDDYSWLMNGYNGHNYYR